MEEGLVAKAKKWLEALSKGRFGYEIETMNLQGLRISLSKKGLMRGSFVVPKALGDKDGNWHTGSIAILVDNFGASTIVSSGVIAKASVNFEISYFSPIKIQEEVEIEAKVLNHRENLCAVVVEIRRKEDGELVVFGKQWMISLNGDEDERLSKL